MEISNMKKSKRCSSKIRLMKKRKSKKLPERRSETRKVISADLFL